MTTNYPSSLDAASTVGGGTKPESTTPLDESGEGHPVHSAMHQNVGDALVAIETKLGTGSSTPAANKVLLSTGSGSEWGTVTGSMMTDNTVGQTQIGTNAVGADELKDDAVNANHLQGTTLKSTVTASSLQSVGTLSSLTVSGDIDANGVLNVSAVEKSTGKDQKIEIKNDKGRLSDEEIKRMVEEAEKYAAEDEANKLRIEAKNSLENYAYSLKNTMSEEKVADKIDASDKESLTAKIDETISWIENNQNAEVEEFEARQKELEGIAMPIMTKLYQSGGAPGGMPDMGGMPGAGGPPPAGGGGGGPHIEEVD